jgi:hypothetical protein
MKKRNVPKLTVSRETLLRLSPSNFHDVVGGLTVGCRGSVLSETACGGSTVCYTNGCPAETFFCIPDNNQD